MKRATILTKIRWTLGRYLIDGSWTWPWNWNIDWYEFPER